MKQTAVEWFMDNIPTRFKNALLDMCKAEIDQAKEMEKEQIIKAYNTSFLLRDKPYSTAEKYYNETFKSEQNGKRNT